MLLFQTAFKNLGKKNYALVIPVFKKLALRYQGMDLERAALYNLANAYKELNKCQKAERIYQNLIPKIQDQFHLKARVYLSLSYVYECLGQSEQTLIALKEGTKYIHYLAEDIRLIEYPVRLFLAYMRVREDKTAFKIQKTVHQNMEAIRKNFRISSKADTSFSKYFYISGRSHIQSQYIYFPLFLKMFFYYQTYLSQSIILKSGVWSVESEKELGLIYRKMWGTLKRVKDKTKYKTRVNNILNQLKNIVRSSQNKHLESIYLILRKKTNNLMVGMKSL